MEESSLIWSACKAYVENAHPKSSLLRFSTSILGIWNFWWSLVNSSWCLTAPPWTSSTNDVYTWGLAPSQHSSAKWRFSLRSPTKHVKILVVTVTGRGATPNVYVKFWESFPTKGIEAFSPRHCRAQLTPPAFRHRWPLESRPGLEKSWSCHTPPEISGVSRGWFSGSMLNFRYVSPWKSLPPFGRNGAC